MVNFKDMKGGDPEGQAKNNSKKPEAKSEPSPMEKMFQGKLDELFYEDKYIHNPIKDIKELSEIIHISARAIQDMISELHEEISNIIKDAK